MISDARAVQVLVDHQRRDVGSCVCGWSKWGASHSEHIWRMLKLAAATSFTVTVTYGGSHDAQPEPTPLT